MRLMGLKPAKKGKLLGFTWAILDDYNGWGKHYYLDFGKCAALTNKKPAWLTWIKLIIAVLRKKL